MRDRAFLVHILSAETKSYIYHNQSISQSFNKSINFYGATIVIPLVSAGDDARISWMLTEISLIDCD